MSTVEKTGVTVDKVGGRIGAVISGVHLSGHLDEGTVGTIRKALLDHKVVFFRGQGHLDDDGHRAFASLLGDLVGHPSTSRYVDGGPIPLAELDSEKGARSNSFHTDVSFVIDPPSFSLLRAVVVPPYGGETAWANAAVAYESLPASLQHLANELWALHSNDFGYEKRSDLDEKVDPEAERWLKEVFSATIFEAEHPLVRVHPETGEPALYLGAGAKKIVGTSATDSPLLLQLFQNHITRLENTVRWRWAVGDLAIWDNRAAQHSGVDDYARLPRKLRRVIVDSQIPRSLDGRSSIIRKGQDSAWYRDSRRLVVA